MAAVVLDGYSSDNIKMCDTSLETCESSLETSNSQIETASDDEDDELLALRIAALESIRLKETKAVPSKTTVVNSLKKPDFVIKSHPKRSNLLSIVTCEEEYEASHSVSEKSPPPITPYFDPTRPPPGYARKSPPPRFIRSPGRRMSRSPRRSRSPPYRRRSISPYARRRRSLSRSPRRRSRSPFLRRPRSPLPVRSRSPLPARSPTPSEWETDTETENEEEDNKDSVKKEKEEIDKPSSETSKPKKEDDPDASVDDVLKLDATEEVDEFSAFLDEFEDKVLAEKQANVSKQINKVKKQRPHTEKKTVDGKRLRKKIKPSKLTSPLRNSSKTPELRRSASPTRIDSYKYTSGRSPASGRLRSPGRHYFSPSRDRAYISPRRRKRTSSPSPDSRKLSTRTKSSPVGRNSKSPGSRINKSKERGSKLKDVKPVETDAEKEEREKKEYEERLQKLPSPDRHVLEARRKKFESKGEINIAESKKISLKSEKKSLKRNDDISEDELNADIGDTLDMFDDPSFNKGGKANVTDLRVQLHKKRQGVERSSDLGKGEKRTTRPSTSPLSTLKAEGLNDDDLVSVSQLGRRKVVPPGKAVGNRFLKNDESDKSPSPPPKKIIRKIRKSGDNTDNSGGLSVSSGRRILVVRKDISREASPQDIKITKSTSPTKEIKKSLHLRLGEKIDQNQFTEDEIYAEMLRRQKDKKRYKKLKKEAKELKKLERLERMKGKKKLRKSKKASASSEDEESLKGGSPGADSSEELFRYFEEQDNSHSERKVRNRNSSGKRETIYSGKSVDETILKKSNRHSVNVDDEDEKIGRVKSRLGKRVSSSQDRLGRPVEKSAHIEVDQIRFDLEKFQASKEEENLDIMEKMKRKNEKRLRRMREIEQDKLMFA